jgi:hypothetical protein
MAPSTLVRDVAAVKTLFVRFLRGGETLYERCCKKAKIDTPGPCNLEPDERLAVWIYTATEARWYERINGSLRGLHHDPDVQFFAEILNEALAKLPRFEGDVYRGMTVPDLDVMAQRYVAGETLGWISFTSCSKVPEQAFHGNVIFIITSQNGRIIGEYADKPTEEEILFRTGFVFEVVAAERRGGRLVIQVAERTL